MSILSAFIIDPVVRHVRRVSGVRAAEASDEGEAHRPTLACDSHDSASHLPPTRHAPRDSEADHPTIQHGDTSDNTRNGSATLIARLRDDVPPNQRLRDAVVDDEAGHDVLPSPATTAPLNIPPVDMSSNPAHTAADQPRRVDVDPSLLSAPPTSSIRRPTATHDGQHAGAMSESLPADDGMAHLRMRIHDIRDLDVSDQERARMIHALMTERYLTTRPTSPSSFVGAPALSEFGASSPYSPASDVDPYNPYSLRPGDTNPTYRPNTQHSAEHADEDEDDVAEGDVVLGCQHYKRNVKVQCYECKHWYTCRHCHDAVEDHNLNRKRTQNMLCMLCGTPQRASEYCKVCETEAACYYCDICKLWDNDSNKKIYHCPDCGICRRGEGLGKDFYHCKACWPLSDNGNH
ncbi:hypothetical protein NX059_008799 [Plenodomus lindquistii]|nr:hypothetical protein NX059_008799 [Plenodomus lindquistii]